MMSEKQYRDLSYDEFNAVVQQTVNVSQRNSLFHFGDVLNEACDNTRSINTKAEADEIIKNCIDLISTQQ